ncbi:hypothetical protein NLU13_2472 [Sarocladium strictum]|uniref:Alpha/beta hydrolase fold-3 domain-containing protein n=1 Tax=Sarocladium strictum TaxID=5046 RepID=A0AA39L9H5_SARSR|nr:hypothetical protein NLU13_2472 [Sarocladium strictum]
MASHNTAPLVKPSLPWTQGLAFGLKVRAIQTAAATTELLGLHSRSPETEPDLVKTYSVRNHLPVRVFFPSSYDRSSAKPLPTLFTIHGGGFCIGSTPDDDAWNRAFADKHSILVVALNYGKAPGAPFPTGLDDLTSLYLAALEDDSLPIDKAGEGRIATCGFSAGGNLSLSLCQRLFQRREQGVQPASCCPRAAVSVYGALDLSRAPEAKVATRQFKPDALSPPRNSSNDFLLGMAPMFDWCYLPEGQDLTDPLLSPGPYANRKHLPPHVFIIASELDMLANDSRECAYRLASPEGKVPQLPAKCGRPEPGRHGELELNDERFHWQRTQGDGSVRWLLVPDVLHAFDSLPMRNRLGGEETMDDADLKTRAYRDILGDWLIGTVWAT